MESKTAGRTGKSTGSVSPWQLVIRALEKGYIAQIAAGLIGSGLQGLLMLVLQGNPKSPKGAPSGGLGIAQS